MARPARKIWNAGSLAALAVIGVLGVLAILLSIFALRSVDVPGGGDFPGTAPTWSPVQGATSSPTATSRSGGSGHHSREIAFADTLNGIRATSGECGGSPATVEATSDGGLEWSPISTSGTVIYEVAAIRYESNDRADIVGKVGSDCLLSVVSTFTGGEFWASYPDRLSEMVYLEQAAPVMAHIRGRDLASPCEGASDLSESGDYVGVICPTGVFVTSAPEPSDWALVGTGEWLALFENTSSGSFYGVAAESGNCGGLSLAVLDARERSASSAGCVSQAGADDIAGAQFGSYLWVWADDRVYESSDGARSWH